MKSDASYVIIGGTGGLGRSMSRWMMSKGARSIVLLSRSGSATGKVAELIAEATEIGATITVLPCDVTSKEAVDKLISTDLVSLPPIRGVIHAAMVLHDVLFEKMTFDQWDSVVKAKVSGAWNFHNALLASSTELDFFIALSSAAGAVGNRGQAAYAAANTFLNAFCQHRNHLGLPASSIDLTAVSDVGYLAENSSRAAEVAENLGSETIAEVEVLALIAAAITGRMQTTCNNHTITGLKISPQTQDLFWVDDARFAHLKSAAAALSASSSDASSANISLSSALKQATSHEKALDLVVDGLITKVSAVLMVPREEMDAARPIVVYGLDSLVAIEIRNWITRELEASLQVLELLTSSSIRALGATILSKSKLVDVSKFGAEGEKEENVVEKIVTEKKPEVKKIDIEVKKIEVEVKKVEVEEKKIEIEEKKLELEEKKIELEEKKIELEESKVEAVEAAKEIQPTPVEVVEQPKEETVLEAPASAPQESLQSIESIIEPIPDAKVILEVSPIVRFKGSDVKIATVSITSSPSASDTGNSGGSSPIEGSPASSSVDGNAPVDVVV